MFLVRKPFHVYESEQDTEHLFHEFLRDPSHRQLIDQWIRLAYWAGPTSTFSRAFYSLWRTDPDRKKLYGCVDHLAEMETAMTLRDMALVLDIGTDLLKLDDPREPRRELTNEKEKEVESCKFKYSESLESPEPFPSVQSLESQWPPTCRSVALTLTGPRVTFRPLPEVVTPVSFKTMKSPFAYLEWHKEIDKRLADGEASSAFRSPHSGDLGEGHCNDSSVGEESMKTTVVNRAEGIATESQSGTHSTRSKDTELAVQVETASSEIDSLGRCFVESGVESFNLSATRQTESPKIHNPPSGGHSEEIENRVKTPVVHPLRSPKSARAEKKQRFSNLNNQSNQSVHVSESMGPPSPDIVSRDNKRPLTIRIPPLNPQSEFVGSPSSGAGFYHDGQPSSPLTPLVPGSSPGAPPGPISTALVGGPLIHRRSARIAKKHLGETVAGPSSRRG
ncbi:hypothetical protein C8R41DRAFT_921748 [Lentinula lateritia]|uniref:Uncharacterized protein n=1 Tax=Lentinula lateritia TaxID=40482 RepID=A0ABQ8VAN3_9AGAR|nr:hypothetical protein C8R41DRAFT_921748 [Lentinula lateritia]